MPELFEMFREGLFEADYNDLHPLVENHLYCPTSLLLFTVLGSFGLVGGLWGIVDRTPRKCDLIQTLR